MQENNQSLGTNRISSNNNDENINVIVRIRGRKNDENGPCTQLNLLDNKSIQVENKTYFYDYVANMNSTQEEMFQHCAKRICDNSLKGYNGTIFAYGQTGSGKTFTLLGPNITKYSEIKINNNFSVDNINVEMNDLSQDNDSISLSMNDNNSNYRLNRKNDNENPNQNLYNYDINDQGIGLLPRIIYYLFNNSQKTENEEFSFKISYLEIYQETISDLLNPDSTKFVQLRDIGSTIILDGLRKLTINSPKEALRYIIQGNKLRHTASTLMNSESSRSHAVISIYIEKKISQRTNNANIRSKIQKSVFHIIDLAGSERQNKTGAFGERTREAGAINKSLLNLSIVIRDIIYNKKQIPYRDSKLTHLLRDSLGGNAKTSIIAAVSPFDYNISETKSTLNFAQNAKKVKNHAIVNEEISGNENMKEMKILKKYNTVLEENIKLKQELLKYQKDNINLQYCIKDVEGLDKGIDEFVRELKELKEVNAKIKDKLEKNDFDFKVKDKEIETLKLNINNLKQNIKILSKEKNDYIAKNAILGGQLKEAEDDKMKLEKYYKDQILIMEQNNSNTEQLINNKSNLINELNRRINEYINQISMKDRHINELAVSLEQKNNIINDVNNQKNNEKLKIESLSKNLDQLKIENELKQKQIEELTKDNNEIKDKGKNLLQKYDEDIDKNSDEINQLKIIIKDKDKKIEKVIKLYHNLEQLKILIENKLEDSSKRISGYLGDIADLNQKNRILSLKYDTLKEKYDKINIDLDNSDDNTSSNNIQVMPKNNYNERRNNFQISKKNPIKRNNTKKLSKSPLNNLNTENLKYKKNYEELKQKYDATLKTISCGKKIKSVQDILDKLHNVEKDLSECRRIMNSSYDKIQDIFSKDMFISDIANQPFNFNCNSLDSSIEQKFFVIFEKFIEFYMIKENQIKSMKEQNEILNQNIHLNEEKKELFELNKNDKNCNSLGKLLGNIAYKSIAKNRKGLLFNNLSTNTKRAFDGYNNRISELIENNDENSNNKENNINNDINPANNRKNNINFNLYPNNAPNSNNILNLFGNRTKEN